jgi:ribonuclease Z
MSTRELFVLGTASQVPTRHRNHNGYFLALGPGEGILFDPGEGTQRQLTIAGLSASSITRICITHFHGDHCLGLAGIIQRLSLDGAGLVSVHYPASGQVLLRASAPRVDLCRP